MSEPGSQNVEKTVAKHSAGRQRWRCTSCGGSSVVRYSTDRADLEAFLGWLLGKETMRSMPGGGRGFRRRMFLIAFIFRKSRDKSFGFHDDCFAS